MSAIALSFQNTQFDIVARDQQPWLRLHQIGVALGYSRADAVNKIYQSNADEFTDSMTALVELDTNGGKQQVRIFSLRGCHLLAMFARTAVAKEFRKWVLDILEKHTQPRYGLLELTPPAPRAKTKIKGGLELHQQDAINDFIKERLVNVPKDKQKGMAIRMYSAINTRFGVTKEDKGGYKSIAPEHFDNIMQLLARLPLDENQLLLLTTEELDAKIEQAIKARDGELLPPATAEEQIVLPLYQNGNIKRMTVKLDHVHVEGDYQSDRWFVARSDDQLTVQRLDPNALVMTFAEFCAHAREYGYIVVKKTEVAAKLMA